jgi:polyisoprenoid-binding protein YceI
VTVDLTSVSSDRSQRDGQFHGRIMNTAKYPTATFTLTDPIDVGTLPAVGKAISVKGTGTLELHGAKKSVTVDLKAQRLGDGIQVSGSIPVTFSDYGIPNPTFGPAKVGDTGTIEFLLDYSR